ncbi:MAG: hypothetical protein IJV46_01440 [Acidaminococcaceae bacterium]|nr:hypothetical protein [Acidaminococcaceae bacterium]
MITDTTKILKVNAEGIPEFLKAQPWWINWKPVFLDGKAKKLPTLGESVLRGQYWENAGRSFADALRTMPENGGVSLLLSLQNELACIDIDDCDASDARLQKIKQLAPDAWYELSPSGHGVHVWGILTDKRSYLLPGRKTIGYCGKDYEWYASGRGITVTGHPVCNINAADFGCNNVQRKFADTAGSTQSFYGKNLVDLTPAVKFCESLRPKIIKAPAVNNTLAANAPSVNFILQKAFTVDPELQRMYYQGHSWDDKSREDFSFCQRLWFWLGGHGQQTIENVFEHSALYRKSKGPGYVSLTVRNAAKRWNGNYYGKKTG